MDCEDALDFLKKGHNLPKESNATTKELVKKSM
jgi:hypothetical protein